MKHVVDHDNHSPATREYVYSNLIRRLYNGENVNLDFYSNYYVERLKVENPEYLI